MNKVPALAAVMAITGGSAIADSINVYNWNDYIAEDTIAKFTEATGIEVVYDIYDTNETLEAKLLAGSSGYDVVVPTSNFLIRQLAVGIYQPLDKSKLPNLANMDPGLMGQAAAYDEGNTHSVIYLWGTTGIGYNVDKVKAALGEDAPVDSLALIFDPANMEKLAECGVAFLDSPSDAMPAAMLYAGASPTSSAPEDFDKGGEVFMKVRPYIRYFQTAQYINDLATGEICVAFGFSGDMFIAQARAEEAGNGVNIAYSVPKEGALQWFDMMAIPADAPNPEGAHAFINFIMDAQITADITNYVWYANANTASMPLVDAEISGNPSIFPTPEVIANLYPAIILDAKADRKITEVWTAIKTGQ
jgi:putrescine transport system substrate-binding protein